MNRDAFPFLLKKIQVLFPEKSMARLREVAAREDRPLSELIRRATVGWLERIPESAVTEREGYQPKTYRLGLKIHDPRKLKAPIYEFSLWRQVTALFDRMGPRRGTQILDAVLAVTLKAQGVKRFYTRNVKDFVSFGLFEVIDPIA